MVSICSSISSPSPLSPISAVAVYYLCGLAFMSLIMFLLGFVALAPYASSALFLVWNCGYQLTVGPSAYVLVGEVSSTRLRAKRVALARNAYNLSLLVNYFVGPYILNPTKGNWKGKTGFLTGGIIIFFWIWAWFRLSETKKTGLLRS
ncbi:uncharacterized protein N7482_010727 [Penicillium canariense]|uniref:Major facilitator superfamily (MFS) profile domain-containing protein n=1 Tax=Penicillium canariense TaxID=189055 RepID=A0A9W9LET5_9EURO|nr:uncharacterized protein N7482_010727 [Penicillium canariense]KAJ5151475.1 hypothetical protein N7482_010727 [Penicillium canariense]